MFLSLLKQQHSNRWRSHSIAFPLQYLTRKQFYRMSFLSYGIAFAKYMAKQGGVIFFHPTKNLNCPTLLAISGIIYYQLELRRHVWKRYYQTTQIIHWNLLTKNIANVFNMVRYCSSFSWTKLKKKLILQEIAGQTQVYKVILLISITYFDTLKTCDFFY